MPTVENRSETRHQVLMYATVFVPSEPNGISCVIRDASTKGCMLVSSYVNEFPDTIEFLVDGIEQRLFGKVMWRSGKMAGVQFDWPACLEQSDEVADWLDLDTDQAVDQ